MAARRHEDRGAATRDTPDTPILSEIQWHLSTQCQCPQFRGAYSLQPDFISDVPLAVRCQKKKRSSRPTLLSLSLPIALKLGKKKKLGKTRWTSSGPPIGGGHGPPYRSKEASTVVDVVVSTLNAVDLPEPKQK